MAPLIDGPTAVFMTGSFATISTLFYNAWTSNRQRRWDKEDADAKAKHIADELKAQTETTRAEIAALVIKTAAELAEKSALHDAGSVERVEHVISKVGEVGAMAEKAYHEANSVNVKIADLQAQNLTLERRVDNEGKG